MKWYAEDMDEYLRLQDDGCPHCGDHYPTPAHEFRSQWRKMFAAIVALGRNFLARWKA